VGTATRTLILFVVGFAFWFVLSGSTAPLTLALGASSALAVAWWNRDLELVTEALRHSLRVLAYLPWLLKEIVVSAIGVMRIVLDPRLPIDPALVRVVTDLRSDLARTTFANSVTLTPGTFTVDVENGVFVIHALTRSGAAGLVVEGAEMVRRVAHAFRERTP
jgi:multicomponent Na+:H+ antiporter subunit E